MKRVSLTLLSKRNKVMIFNKNTYLILTQQKCAPYFENKTSANWALPLNIRLVLPTKFSKIVPLESAVLAYFFLKLWCYICTKYTLKIGANVVL